MIKLARGKPAMAPTDSEVRAQLERIATSRDLTGAPRMQELLRYLVESVLAGDAERLKGYAIGVDVFGKADQFDPRLDSTVRVQIGRLRKLLDDYAAGPGKTDPVEIRLNKGSYVPVIQARDAVATGQTLIDPGTAGEPPAPVNIFSPNGEAEPASARKSSWWLQHPAFTVAGLIVATVLTIGGVMLAGRLAPSTYSAALAHPTGPVIFVAQFRTIGDDALATQIRDGLQFELVDRLSRFPELGVLGIDTVSGATEESAWKNLHKASFVLTGSVQVLQGEVQVTSQLIRANDHTVAWSDVTQGETSSLAGMLAIQSRIATSVATQLGQPYGVIQESMKRELETTRSVSMEDYGCTLQAYTYMRNKNVAEHATVRDCLERVVKRSPGYSSAWALLSWVYGDEERYGFNRRTDGPPPLERAITAAERAVQADANNATAHEYLAVARYHLHDDKGFRQSIAQALKLNPNNSEILANAGWGLILSENSPEGHKLLEKAIELNPGHPPWYHGGLAMYALQNSMPREALENAVQYSVENSPEAYYLLAAAKRLNGDQEGADAVLTRLGQLNPNAITNRRQMVQSLRISPKVAKLIFGKDYDEST